MADGTDLISRLRAKHREEHEQGNISFNLDVLEENLLRDKRKISWDSTVSTDRFYYHRHIDFNSLVNAIEKYNNDINQGFIISEKIDYDPTLLNSVIDHYNNLIKNK